MSCPTLLKDSSMWSIESLLTVRWSTCGSGHVRAGGFGTSSASIYVLEMVEHESGEFRHGLSVEAVGRAFGLHHSTRSAVQRDRRARQDISASLSTLRDTTEGGQSIRLGDVSGLGDRYHRAGIRVSIFSLEHPQFL